MAKKNQEIVEDFSDDLEDLLSDDEDEMDDLGEDFDDLEEDASEDDEIIDTDDLDALLEGETDDEEEAVETPPAKPEKASKSKGKKAEKVVEVDFSENSEKVEDLEDLETEFDLDPEALDDILGDTDAGQLADKNAAEPKSRKKKAKIEPSTEVTVLPKQVMKKGVEFDPDKDGEKVAGTIKRLNQSFVESCVEIGEVIRRAKKFYKGNDEAYRGWLSESAGIAYSSAQFYLNASKVFEDPKLCARAVEVGWNSAHIKELMVLAKKPDVIEEFLTSETVELPSKNGEPPREVKVSDLQPKEVRQVVREKKKELAPHKEKEPKEEDHFEVFMRFMKRLNTTVVSYWDDVRDYSGKLPFKVSELDTEEAVFLTNSAEEIEGFSKYLAKLAKSLKK